MNSQVPRTNWWWVGLPVYYLISRPLPQKLVDLNNINFIMEFLQFSEAPTNRQVCLNLIWCLSTLLCWKKTHQEKISICQNNYVVDVDKTKNKCGDQIIVDVVKTKNRSSLRSSYCLPILPSKHSRHLRLENAVFDLNT